MSDYEEELRLRLAQAFGDKPPQDAFQQWRAIVGASDMPELMEALRQAHARLLVGERLEPRDLRALEEILRIRRPALVAQPGHTLSTADDETRAAFPDWDAFAAQATSVLRGCARIDWLDWAGNEVHVGSGFLVAPDVLMTNRHVLKALSRSSMTLGSGDARASFARYPDEYTRDRVDIVAAVGFTWEADLALLRLERPRPPEDVLSWASAPAQPGQTLVVVGHPADDPREDHFKDFLFGRRFGLKHASPGLVVRRQGTLDRFDHDSSTLKGHSGSPVLDMATATVVGVHFSGLFFQENSFEGAHTAEVSAEQLLGAS